jgi:hypothetical protein
MLIHMSMGLTLRRLQPVFSLIFGSQMSVLYFLEGMVPEEIIPEVGNAQIASVATTPLPAALPLFATGLGLMGLLGWRRKRKASAALTAS